MVSYIPSPQQPAPIGAGTYTTWPGGVDPTARLYNTDNTAIPCAKGGRRRTTRRRRNVMRKKSRRVHRK
jgi:hypothetical protein